MFSEHHLPLKCCSLFFWSRTLSECRCSGRNDFRKGSTWLACGCFLSEQYLLLYGFCSEFVYAVSGRLCDTKWSRRDDGHRGSADQWTIAVEWRWRRQWFSHLASSGAVVLIVLWGDGQLLAFWPFFQLWRL